MNSGCVVAPEPWNDMNTLAVPDDIKSFSEEQAINFVHITLELWQNMCRIPLGVSPVWFAPWHHEVAFVREAMLEADTGDLVRSIVMGFNRKCREYQA